MLVDVRQLRHRGEKLTPEAVAAAAPVRGHLSIVRTEASEIRAHAETHAHLTEGPSPASRAVLPPLLGCRINRMAGDEFVLVGEQEVREGTTVMWYRPQSWWCTLARPDLSELTPLE